jgi:cell wall-associated NlpC family hydrolase
MNRAGLHNSAPPADRVEMTRLLVIIMGAASLAACASSGVVYTPRPFPGAPVVEGGPASSGAPGAPAAPVAPVAPVAPAAPVAPVAPVAPALPADGYALSGTALSLRGAPYRLGGVDPATGFDCSGFVRYVYQQHGVPMPREVREQFRIGKTVDRRKLEPGDLVFFSTVAPGASHVGIVIGGDQFVHAPSERGVVRVENLSAEYWSSRYVGAKRVN